ncbi:MAG: TatD family hydrolase [Puniceicoccaceae bacterium]
MKQPTAGYHDAHLHLQEAGLLEAMGNEGLDQYRAFVRSCVTNGTHPDDWPAVEAIAGGCVKAAYGVHPWKVDDLPADWEEQLRGYLSRGAVSVGEIGLDNWIEPRNEALQREVFEKQLHVAAEYKLAPTIHCLRAWGMLVDCLRSGPDLPKGFLVHGFGGSRETLFELLDLGGHVSFSAYAADPGRKRMRDAARACPADRILVETDAPDMVPPADVCRHDLQAACGSRLHHPSDIETAYAFLAEWRGEELESFAEQVAQTFQRLFGPVN